MAKDYPEVFPDSFDQNNYTASSTDYNRTYASAYSHLMGIMNHTYPKLLKVPKNSTRVMPPFKYPPTDAGTLGTGYPFALLDGMNNPVIKTTEKQYDKVIKPTYSCPNKKKMSAKGYVLRERIGNLPNLVEIEKRTNENYNITTNEKPGSSLVNKLFSISDSVISDYFQNKSARFGPKDEFYKQMELTY